MLRLTLALLATTPALSQTTWTVSAGGQADFSDIQPAVDAAVDGDVIRVGPGVYSGVVIQDEDLHVLALGASVHGRVEVLQLAAGRTVTLTGLAVSPPPEHDSSGLRIEGCQGRVLIQDCTFDGPPGQYDEYGDIDVHGGVAGVVDGCAGVVLSRCTFEAPGALAEHGFAEDGREALVIADSFVSLVDCSLRGGHGAHGWKSDGGDGGHGLLASGTGRVVLSGGTLEGGDGGDGYDADDCIGPPPGDGGDGGHGLVAGLALVDELDCVKSGGDPGQGGTDACGPLDGDDGVPGAPVSVEGPASYTVHPGVAGRWELTPTGCKGAASTISVHGPVGATAELVWDDVLGWDFDPLVAGVWAPKSNVKRERLGVVPAGGSFTTTVKLKGPGAPFAHVFAQLLTTDGVGTRRVGSVTHALAYDGKPESYCVTSPNSVGAGARITANGSTSLSLNDWTLVAYDGPPQEAGLFFYGPQQDHVPLADGVLCVGGGFARLAPSVSGHQGTWAVDVDFGAEPFDAGPGRADPGSTWYFQLWYRDPAGPGGAGSNFSDGLIVTFCP